MDEYIDSLLLNTINVTGKTPAQREDNTIDIKKPLTVVYVLILIAGILGNVCTGVVIFKNKQMHTATNYYLFSLALSDLMLLLCGLPFEIEKLWNPSSYPFGDLLCIATGLGSETAANATVLTITAFTVERYLAICRPFASRTISNLSRAVKYIIAIWIISLLTAVPLAFQFGVETYSENGRSIRACTVKGFGFYQVFVLSSFTFFIVPMSIITVLYVLIIIKLRTSRVLNPVQMTTGQNDSINRAKQRQYTKGATQRRVIRMLVAVAVSFFICWAPFHVQRVIAIFGKSMENPSDTFYMVYVVLTNLSGVLYFLSTAINPVLYSIMSNKFRNAFKVTLTSWCGKPPSDERQLPAAQTRARRLHRFNMATIQHDDESSRAQCYDMRHGPAIFESTSGFENCSGGGWRFDRNEATDSVESPHSISNSSLVEIGDEYTGEEMVPYLFETNCAIRGIT